MKRWILKGLLVLCIIGIILGIYFILNNRIKTYTKIDYKEYSDMVENKKDFILYIGSADCSHCQEFQPILEQFIKNYQLDIKYIDISVLKDKEYLVLKNKTKLSGTPTIVIFKSGIVESGNDNKIQGTVSYDKLESFFKEHNYIK